MIDPTTPLQQSLRPARRPTRAQLVRAALAAVGRAGGDVDVLIREFGLSASAVSDPATVLPLTTLHALLERAEALTGDPLLGIDLARHRSPGAYGLIAYVARTAATVADQLRCTARYTPIINEVVTASVTETPETLLFEHYVAGEPLGLGRHGNECLVAIVLFDVRAFTGHPIVPEQGWVAHPAPPVADEVRRALDMPGLRFGAERNGVLFSRRDADRPLLTADEPLHALLVRQAERELEERRQARDTYTGLVRQTVRDQFREGLPTLATVGRALRTSERTLQRRLLERDTRFADLVDGVREELAVVLVADPARSIGEIAYLLHYADPSTFIRAFRRWTGTTPGAWRAGGG